MRLHAPRFSKFWITLDETVNWLLKSETNQQTSKPQRHSNYVTLPTQIRAAHPHYQGNFSTPFWISQNRRFLKLCNSGRRPAKYATNSEDSDLSHHEIYRRHRLSKRGHYFAKDQAQSLCKGVSRRETAGWDWSEPKKRSPNWLKLLLPECSNWGTSKKSKDEKTTRHTLRQEN